MKGFRDGQFSHPQRDFLKALRRESCDFKAQAVNTPRCRGNRLATKFDISDLVLGGEKIMRCEMRQPSVMFSATFLAMLFALANSAHANLILNPDFDAPDISSDFETLNDAPSGFGWTIVSDGTPNLSATTGVLGVDLINTFWVGTGGTTNPDGRDQSVDIDGASSISQSFATTIGTEYLLEFSYSHHYLAGASTASLLIEGTNTLVSETLLHNISNSPSNMQWLLSSHAFVADSGFTTLTLQGLASQGGTGFCCGQF